MNGANERPTPNNSTATGVARVWIRPDLTGMLYEMTNTVVSANNAHIHRGGPDVAGPVVYPLAFGPNVSGTLPLTAGDLYDLMSGNFYVNIHSPTFPGGEIRGQLRLVRQFQAVLRGTNEVPPNTSTHTGSASFIFNRDTNQLA
jgi:hypothetical protein